MDIYLIRKNVFIDYTEIKNYLITGNKIEIEQEQIFEKIENYGQLLPNIYYKMFLKSVTKEEIHDFNQYLINNYNYKFEQINKKKLLWVTIQLKI